MELILNTPPIWYWRGITRRGHTGATAPSTARRRHGFAHRTLDEVLSDIATVARVKPVCPLLEHGCLHQFAGGIGGSRERIPQKRRRRVRSCSCRGLKQNLVARIHAGAGWAWVGKLLTRANARNVGAGPGVAYRVPSFESILGRSARTSFWCRMDARRRSGLPGNGRSPSCHGTVCGDA